MLEQLTPPVVNLVDYLPNVDEPGKGFAPELAAAPCGGALFVFALP